MSKRRTENAKASRKSTVASDDFGDDGLDDDTLVKAACGDLKFDHIEAYPDPLAPTTHGYNAKIKSHKGKETGQSKIVKGLPETLIKESTNNATRLPNGKWACNHPCKDREACKHFCCKNGMDKPPKKKPVTRSAWSGEPQLQPQQKVSPLKGKETQTKLQLVASKRKAPSQIEELDLTRQEKKQKEDHVTNDSREHHELQNKVKVNVVRSATGSVIDTKPSYCYSPDADSNSFMDPSVVATPPVSSDYGNIQFDETLDYLDLPQQHDALSDLYDAELECGDFIGCEPTVLDASPRSEKFDDDDDPLLGDAMIGLADSHMLQDDNEDETDTMHTMKSAPRWTDKENFQEAQHRTDDEFADINSDMHAGLLRNTSSRTLRQSQIATVEGSCPIFEDCKSESKVEGVHLEAVKVALDNKSENPNSSKTNTKLTRTDKGEYESTIEGGTQTQWATSEKAASVASSGKSAPGAFTGLEPWLFQEFGDIVELIDE
jgi:ATP-dependent DNA helicase HFM1/MER3